MKLHGRGTRPRLIEVLVGLIALAAKAAGGLAWWASPRGGWPDGAMLPWLALDAIVFGLGAFGVAWMFRVRSERATRRDRSRLRAHERVVRKLIDSQHGRIATALAHADEGRRRDHDRLRAQLYEIRREQSEVRSDTEFLVSRSAGMASRSSQRRVLMITSNGAGLGHLTRCLALMEALPQGWTVDILTLSTGWRKVDPGRATLYYFPSKDASGLPQGEWHRRFAQALSRSLDALSPDVIFFDGTAVYRAIHEAARHRLIPLIWIVRGGWKAGVQNEQTAAPERIVDALLLPGDHAIGDEPAPVRTDVLPLMRTPPLIYAPRTLDAQSARAKLGLAEGDRHVLIQLGAGNIDDIGSNLLAAVNAVKRLGDGWHPVVVDSPIARNYRSLPEQTIRISAYPLSEYYCAFEFVVVAAGYNTVQEVISLSVPAVFVPNPDTLTDDQVRRASAALERGLALMARNAEEVAVAVGRLADLTVRSGLREALAQVEPGGIAAGVEEWVISVIEQSAASTNLQVPEGKRPMAPTPVSGAGPFMEVPGAD